jgi:hypothetical protein
MRRPWTWLLLLLFLTVQVYGLKRTEPAAGAGSQVAKILPVPAGLLRRNGRVFLVTATDVYRLDGSGTQPTVEPVAAQWQEVPEPSGSGVWHVLVQSSGLVLMGLDGWVAGSPITAAAIYVDPGTRTPFLAGSPGASPVALARGGLRVLAWHWAASAPVAVFLADGWAGPGFYAGTPAGEVTWEFAAPPAQVASFGYGNGGVVAVTRQGTLLYRGQTVGLPPERPAWASTTGIVLGWQGANAIWWQGGRTVGRVRAPRPMSRPAMAPAGDEAAYWASVDGRPRLICLTPSGYQAVAVAFDQARIIGWYRQDILLAVLTGPQAGTYTVKAP